MNKIISFYKFKQLKDLITLKEKIHCYLSENNIKGTVLIACEGININLCGEENKIDQSINYIKKIVNIKNIHINQAQIQEKAFKQLKVKIKKVLELLILKMKLLIQTQELLFLLLE